MDKCYAAFGIGKHSRNERTLLVNIENAARRSACLSFIEGYLETVMPTEDDDCPLNWGDSPEAYLKKFKTVWNTRPEREGSAEALLERFRSHVKSTALGEEHLGRGASTYNWGKHYISVLEMHLALLDQEQSRKSPEEKP